MRVYYGTCQYKPNGKAKCGRLVTTRRSIQGRQFKDGKTLTGRWPETCPECAAVKYEKDQDAARGRMRRRRAAGKAEAKRLRDSRPLEFEEGSRLGLWALPGFGLARRRLGIDCPRCGEPVYLTSKTIDTPE
jgi:hypothetical protein